MCISRAYKSEVLHFLFLIIGDHFDASILQVYLLCIVVAIRLGVPLYMVEFSSYKAAWTGRLITFTISLKAMVNNVGLSTGLEGLHWLCDEAKRCMTQFER